MSNRVYFTFTEAIEAAERQLKEFGELVPVDRWQAVETEGHFRELMNFQFSCSMARGAPSLEALVDSLADEIKPNLPWADRHFEERVSGIAHNPGETYKIWPFWREGSAEREMMQVNQTAPDQYDLKFSHTYMERFWPKWAGYDHKRRYHRGPQGYKDGVLAGIRFTYGDLQDVIHQLADDPHTRQAYLPVWFPEDTGAVHGERVPCSLGYHFMMRGKHLHCWYDIRSCDIVHYFRDDIYLAVRLTLWVLDQLRSFPGSKVEGDFWAGVGPGFLHMSVHSLHVFGGDFSVKST